MKWYTNIVEPGDPVTTDEEYLDCVNPIYDRKKEGERIFGYVTDEEPYYTVKLS